MIYVAGIKTKNLKGEFEIRPEIERVKLNPDYSNKDSEDHLNIERMYYIEE